MRLLSDSSHTNGSQAVILVPDFATEEFDLKLDGTEKASSFTGGLGTH
jgi:hypothetical protein